MSGTVVRQPATFQQQGSVDWVELSGRSVQFSVAVLARLSRAGIDPFTLQVGRAICTNFSLHPAAQGRISDAILALKKFGSYGDVIWFGFGVKHVVTDLAETEEGLTLVALCAALSTIYDSHYGARVLRQLCCLCKAPQLFSPAIRQWKILVELCAGILTSSHFVLVLDGFHRLVSGGRNAVNLAARRCPTTCSALAEAILTIAQVTNRRLASATFTGGLDCVWLAAVAEWIFSLDIVIYSSAGVLLYRSRSLDQQPPQITLVYLETNEYGEEVNFVSEKTSLISSGRTLFVHEDTNSLGGLHFFNWRSSWSTILHDTFHDSMDQLLKQENACQFGLYLYCVSMIQEPDLRLKRDNNPTIKVAHILSNNFVDPLLWTQESSRGHKFLAFASKRLPELWPCTQHDFSWVPQDKIISVGASAYGKIEELCKYHNTLPHPECDICVGKLADVIIIFLWITLVSDIDGEIPPSITGLNNLCRWLDRRHSQVDILNYECKQPQQTALVFHVLSGLLVDSEEQGSTTLPSNYLAMAGAGICVYRQALADPNLPPDSIFRYRVVPGYISHDGAVFRRIRNLSGRNNTQTYSFDASSIVKSSNALVQETDRDSELAMAYQVNYIDSKGKRKYVFMNIGRLLRHLQTRVFNFECEDRCLKLPIKSQQDVKGTDMAQQALSWRNTRRYPNVFFDQAAIINAQRLVADLRGLSNLWVLTWTNSFNDRSPTVDMLISHPLMIYLYLVKHSERALCLFPFNTCLSCMIECGCLTRIYSYSREIMPPTGSILLRGPENTCEDMQWETLNPIYREVAVPSESNMQETQPVVKDCPSTPTFLPESNDTASGPNQQQDLQSGESCYDCITDGNSPSTRHDVNVRESNKPDTYSLKEKVRHEKSRFSLASIFRSSGGSSFKKP